MHGVVRKYSSSFFGNRTEKTREVFLFCIPVFLLFILALPFISSGYWEDEIFSVTTSRSWSGMFGIFRNYENNMALYYVVLHVWMRIFGEGEVATHSLSLLFAVVTIPVFFRLEREWMSKSTALYGTILLAANPLFVFYALESRSYSFLTLSATISTLIFVRLMRKPGFGLAVYYGLSVAAGIYIHYFGILLLLVHAMTIRRKQLTRQYFASFLMSALIFFVAILPLLLFPPRDNSQISWILRPDFKYFWYTIKELFGGGYAIVLLTICLCFATWKGDWKNFRREGYFLLMLSIAWAVLPVSLVYIFSILVKPAFLTRFFTWCLPGAVLLTCILIDKTGWNQFRKAIVWFILICILLFKSYGILKTRGSGYPEAVQWLNEHIRPGEAVLTYPFYKAMHVSFYLNKLPSPKPYVRPIAITNLPYLPGGGGRDPDPDLETISKIAAGYNRVYIICRKNEGAVNPDSILNRVWLPVIQKIMNINHPHQQEKIFGLGTEESVRIIVFE